MAQLKETTINNRDILAELDALKASDTIATAIGNVGMRSDAEGGNLWVTSPQGNEWQMDAHNEKFRLFRWGTDSSYQLGYAVEHDGDFYSGGDVVTSSGVSLNALNNSKWRLVYNTSVNAAAANSVNIDLSDCFAVIIVANAQDTNHKIVSAFVPIGGTAVLWNTDQYATGTCCRTFTVSSSSVSWTASTNSNYPNAFVIPQKIYALPNTLLS